MGHFGKPLLMTSSRAIWTHHSSPNFVLQIDTIRRPNRRPVARFPSVLVEVVATNSGQGRAVCPLKKKLSGPAPPGHSLMEILSNITGTPSLRIKPQPSQGPARV